MSAFYFAILLQMDNFYFKFGTITNCAALSILEQGFGDTCVHFSVGYVHLRVGLLDYRLCMCSALVDAVKQFSKISAPVSTPISSSSTSSPALGVTGLNLHSPDDYEAEWFYTLNLLGWPLYSTPQVCAHTLIEFFFQLNCHY